MDDLCEKEHEIVGRPRKGTRYAPDDCKMVGIRVPLRQRKLAAEIQSLHGDCSMAQIWRHAIAVGLEKMIREIKG